MNPYQQQHAQTAAGIGGAMSGLKGLAAALNQAKSQQT
jgi:hypothetical protein